MNEKVSAVIPVGNCEIAATSWRYNHFTALRAIRTQTRDHRKWSPMQ
jgi:hypothetical protein